MGWGGALLDCVCLADLLEDETLVDNFTTVIRRTRLTTCLKHPHVLPDSSPWPANGRHASRVPHRDGRALSLSPQASKKGGLTKKEANNAIAAAAAKAKAAKASKGKVPDKKTISQAPKF